MDASPATADGVEPLLPEHHAVALDVDAAASGTPGELGVLPRRDVGVGLAVPLRELLDHHRARGHVDAEGERLGREHDAAQAAHEQLLDALLEGRQHAGVVGGDAAGQAVEELVVAEDAEVLLRQVRAVLLDEGEDLVALLRRGQPQVGLEALLHRRVAADPAEDEDDGRQQSGPVELVDDLGAPRRPDAARASGPAVGTLAPARRSAVADPVRGPVVAGHPQELGVDLLVVVRPRPRRRTGRTSVARRRRAGTAGPAGAPRRWWWSRHAPCRATRRTPRRC